MWKAGVVPWPKRGNILHGESGSIGSPTKQGNGLGTTVQQSLTHPKRATVTSTWSECPLFEGQTVFQPGSRLDSSRNIYIHVMVAINMVG